MTDWYYADRHHRQQGPVGADEIRRLLHAGSLHGQSLVWTEGMADWQPLDDCRDRLGADLPPPAPEPPALPGGADLPLPAGPLPGTAGDVPASPAPVVHAGFVRRYAAATVDYLLSQLCILVLGVVGTIPLAVTGVMLDSQALAYTLTGLWVLALLLLVPALYNAGFQCRGAMATPGKRLAGIRLCRPDGRALGFWRIVARHFALLAFVVVTCGIGLLVSALMVAFTERRQGLHDMVCDAVVVDRWAFTSTPERQRRGPGALAIVIALLSVPVFLGLALLGQADTPVPF